ncbi:hypothetical protein ACHAWF_006828 [Thalassiosira exigua]
MDSLDVFICLAKRDCNRVNKVIRLFFKAFSNNIFSDGRMQDYLTNTYSFCLYKDVSNPDQLRPIGVPTAMRRILCSHIASACRKRFARKLVPFNFAVGVEGGMDFMVRAAQLGVEKYITVRERDDLAPISLLLSLDLKNMFNELSRGDIFRIIRHDFLDLLPLVTLLYAKPGTVWYRMTDGEWYTQLMVTPSEWKRE